jgi:hypothetical protein
MATSFNEEATRTALKESGLTEEQVEKSIAKLRSLRETAGIQVKVNPVAERKYGDVTIVKVQPDGYTKTLGGVWHKDVRTLAAALLDAADILDKETGTAKS